MSIKQQTPQIRFTGFSEDWIEKKLADVLKIKSGLSQKEIEVADGIYPILATGGEIGRTNTALYNKESVLIGRKGTIDKPYYMNTPFWTVDTLFYSELSEHVSGLFVFTLFQKIQWRKLDTSTGVPSLTSSTIHNIIANFPTKDEQTAIGNLFQSLDQTIALQRRKHEQTQTLKKSLLSKMFPKKGQKQPEIRLKGFSGDWVEVKLGNVLLIRSMSVDSDDFDVDIELENIESETGIIIGNTSVRTQANSYFARGDVLFGRLRPYLKKWWLADVEGVKSGEIWAFYSEMIESEFIYALVQTNAFLNATNVSSGSKMPRADWSSMAKVKVFIPNSKKEQTAIGQFFKQLDDTVSIQAKQLKTLENLKKALLAKMFV